MFYTYNMTEIQLLKLIIGRSHGTQQIVVYTTGVLSHDLNHDTATTSVDTIKNRQQRGCMTSLPGATFTQLHRRLGCLNLISVTRFACNQKNFFSCLCVVRSRVLRAASSVDLCIALHDAEKKFSSSH